MQATSLPFIVAATAIGRELDLIDAAASAALIGAGLLSVLLFPLGGLLLLRREPRAGRRRAGAADGDVMVTFARRWARIDIVITSDEQILAALKRGDEAAFIQLVELPPDADAARRAPLRAQLRGRRGGRAGDVARRAQRAGPLRGPRLAEDVDLPHPHQPRDQPGGARGAHGPALRVRAGRRPRSLPSRGRPVPGRVEDVPARAGTRCRRSGCSRARRSRSSARRSRSCPSASTS